MLNRLLTLLLLGCALSAWSASWAMALRPAPAPALALDVERVDGGDGGKVYRIASSGTVAARPADVWRILTDYEHLADYLPDLKSARILARDGDKVTIEQLGTASFLFFNRDIHLVVQAHERAPDRIDVDLVDGDMKVYRCRWELVPTESGGTTLRYQATIEPKFYVPGIVGTNLVRKDVARMMTAVLLRLDRDPQPYQK